MKNFLDELIERYPKLISIRDSIDAAYKIIEKVYENDGTLFLCGNGGSCSDAEHIAGELLKGFLLKRELKAELKAKFQEKLGSEGLAMASKLQYGLKAVSLFSNPSYITAFANDVDPDLIYAQQLFALGRKNDAVIGISSSGNSKNVLNTLKLASVMGIKSIIMTGKSGGKAAYTADCAIKVPETETYKIQELHLPIYHTLCMMLEDRFYGKN